MLKSYENIVSRNKVQLFDECVMPDDVVYQIINELNQIRLRSYHVKPFKK